MSVCHSQPFLPVRVQHYSPLLWVNGSRSQSTWPKGCGRVQSLHYTPLPILPHPGRSPFADAFCGWAASILKGASWLLPTECPSPHQLCEPNWFMLTFKGSSPVLGTLPLSSSRERLGGALANERLNWIWEIWGCGNGREDVWWQCRGKRVPQHFEDQSFFEFCLGIMEELFS